MDTVQRYTLAVDKWQLMPNLNVARRNAGACFQGGSIYVIGGEGKRDVCLNSIEKLDLENATRWQLIKLTKGNLHPRSDPVVVAQNSQEIVILGGHVGLEDQTDIVLFDTRTYKCKKVARGVFKSHGNQYARTAANKIVSMVKCGHRYMFFEYTKDDEAVKVYYEAEAEK